MAPTISNPGANMPQLACH